MTVVTYRTAQGHTLTFKGHTVDTVTRREFGRDAVVRRLHDNTVHWGLVLGRRGWTEKKHPVLAVIIRVEKGL